jgi:dihydropteroate synthase
MIGNTLHLPTDQRVEGTIATTVVGIMKGCDFVRVHDIEQNRRAIVMTDAIVRR